MSNIGSFKKVGAEFHGEVATLELQAQGVRFVPESGRSGDNPPSHLIYIGRVEIGAAWPQKAASGREYHSVKLDDPKLSAPISANLFADDKGDGYSLIWSRPRPKTD